MKFMKPNIKQIISKVFVRSFLLVFFSQQIPTVFGQAPLPMPKIGNMEPCESARIVNPPTGGPTSTSTQPLPGVPTGGGDPCECDFSSEIPASSSCIAKGKYCQIKPLEAKVENCAFQDGSENSFMSGEWTDAPKEACQVITKTQTYHGDCNSKCKFENFSISKKRHTGCGVCWARAEVIGGVLTATQVECNPTSFAPIPASEWPKNTCGWIDLAGVDGYEVSKKCDFNRESYECRGSCELLKLEKDNGCKPKVLSSSACKLCEQNVAGLKKKKGKIKNQSKPRNEDTGGVTSAR